MGSQKFVLQITDGPDAGLCFGIAGESVLIGRAAECDIRLENARGISRTHCRVFVMDDGLRVQDLGSQNGTIVQGKRISDAIIKPGVSFKIGDVTFLVQTAENMAARYALSPADASVPAAFGGGAPVAAGGQNGGGIEKAQAFMEAAGEGSRKVLWQLAILIAVVVAGLYLIQLVAMSEPLNSVFALVKAYEPKAVDFRVPFDHFQVEKNKTASGRQVISVRDYNGLLVPSLKRLNNNRNAPKRRMMVVEGGAEGDALVALYDGANNLLGSFRIVCRGSSPYHVAEDLTQDRARVLATQELTQAKAFLQDNRLYDAWLHYLRGSDLCNGAANDPMRGSDAMVEVQRLRSLLSDQLCTLFDNALAAAFPEEVSIRKPDYNEALRILEDARGLIPDERSVDRQIIEQWMIIVNTYKAQSARRR